MVSAKPLLSTIESTLLGSTPPLPSQKIQLVHTIRSLRSNSGLFFHFRHRSLLTEHKFSQKKLGFMIQGQFHLTIRMFKLLSS